MIGFLEASNETAVAVFRLLLRTELPPTSQLGLHRQNLAPELVLAPTDFFCICRSSHSTVDSLGASHAMPSMAVVV